VKILLISSGCEVSIVRHADLIISEPIFATIGNTNGSLESGSNHSVSSTNKEQGAWWQVDLGGAKLIPPNFTPDLQWVSWGCVL
jgi:hypothetical protein